MRTSSPMTASWRVIAVSTKSGEAPSDPGANYPHEPGKRRCAGRARAIPASAVHHWKTIAEDVNAGELATFKNGTAALRFQEREPQQHDHAGAER